MRQRVVPLLAALALTVTAAAGSSAIAAETSVAASGAVTPGVSFAPTDQVVVKFRPGQAPNGAALARQAGVEVVSARVLSADTVVVKLPAAQSGAALRATVSALAKRPGVEWAEPDVMMSVTEDLSGQQWDLGSSTAAPYGIDLAGGLAALQGASSLVTVAVVDTGYVDHVDLDSVVLDGHDFISDARIANDGDGRDGDAADPGDWLTNQEVRRGFFRGCPSGDSSWHGTHVAGTIAAERNGDGIDGINPYARILPVRVLGKCGGYTSDITDGVRWAAGLPVAGAPVNQNVAGVVNLSLGGGGACSSLWQGAIDDATAAGTLVVVAAGNADGDAGSYSPASCNGVVTVASTGQAGDRAYYSNSGAAVELAAPGGDRLADDGDTILSTLNSGTTSPVSGGDVYVKYQGTSMAAPHVAGVASLMLSANPDLTPADLSKILTDTATPFPVGSTCAGICGTGIVDAADAVAVAKVTTPTPTTTTTTTTTTQPAGAPGDFDKTGVADGTTGLKKSVTLSWEPSAGATEYWVCVDVSVDGVCDTFASGPYTGTGVRFVGLASGTTFEWQVRADNGVGSTVATSPPWTFATR